MQTGSNQRQTIESNASRWRALALKPFLNPFPLNWPRVQRVAVCSELVRKRTVKPSEHLSLPLVILYIFTISLLAMVNERGERV